MLTEALSSDRPIDPHEVWVRLETGGVLKKIVNDRITKRFIKLDKP
ncbi:MAG: hypothetical protein ACW972_10580 [Promethearchaeota archaeon]|jgi:hypothetical protein